MQVPQYDQMLGDNLIADEAAEDPHERGGGNGLTRHQKTALGAGRGADAQLWPGAPCGSCGADEPRVLGRSLAILWAAAFATFVLAAAALGASARGAGSGDASARWSPNSECREGHQGTQLFGEELLAFGGHHYQVVGASVAQLTWHQARLDAGERCYGGTAGHLVYIGSDEENAFVVDAVKALPAGRLPAGLATHAWIGATDMRAEGRFEWVGGRHTGEVFYDTTLGETVDERTVTYAHWSEGEPNDASGGEDCVQLMVGTGTLSSFWSDENCYKPNEFFIVEFDA